MPQRPRRYELTDFEWSVIAPLLPNKPRGVARVDDRRVLNRHLLAVSVGVAVGRHTVALWAADHLQQPLRAMASGRSMGQTDGRHRHKPMTARVQMIDSTSVRVHHSTPGTQKGGRNRCMGRSRGA